jgi:hypothetical protein
MPPHEQCFSGPLQTHARVLTSGPGFLHARFLTFFWGFADDLFVSIT